MSYTLRAVIGPEDVVRSVAEDLGLTAIPLEQGWHLMPWTTEAFDALGPSDEGAEVAGFYYCHSSLVSVLRTASALAPVAYVEADCWAGQCTQGAVVYEAGGAAWLSEFGLVLSPRPGRRTPISEALARIGVEARETALDEFDSVGLGFNRRTEDWVVG